MPPRPSPRRRRPTRPRPPARPTTPRPTRAGRRGARAERAAEAVHRGGRSGGRHDAARTGPVGVAPVRWPTGHRQCSADRFGRFPLSRSPAFGRSDGRLDLVGGHALDRQAGPARHRGPVLRSSEERGRSEFSQNADPRRCDRRRRRSPRCCSFNYVQRHRGPGRTTTPSWSTSTSPRATSPGAPPARRRSPTGRSASAQIPQEFKPGDGHHHAPTRSRRRWRCSTSRQNTRDRAGHVRRPGSDRRSASGSASKNHEPRGHHASRSTRSTASAGFLVPGDEVNIMVVNAGDRRATSRRPDQRPTRCMLRPDAGPVPLPEGADPGRRPEHRCCPPGEQRQHRRRRRRRPTTDRPTRGLITFNVPPEAAQWIASAQHGGGIYLVARRPRTTCPCRCRRSTCIADAAAGRGSRRSSPPTAPTATASDVTSPFSGQPGRGPCPSLGRRRCEPADGAPPGRRRRRRRRPGRPQPPGHAARRRAPRRSPSIDELAGAPRRAARWSSSSGPSFADGHRARPPPSSCSRARREVGAIMVTDELTTDLLQRALRAGVKDVLAGPGRHRASWPRPSQRVAASLGSCRRRHRDRRVATLEPATTASSAGSSRCSPPRAAPASRSSPPTSPSLLAQRSEKPVVLVDADLQFGDIAVMLKLSPQHTIVDAVGVARPPRRRRCCESLLVEHEPSGLLVLPAPLEPAFADQIGAAEMVAHRRAAPHVLLASWSSTRRPTSTTWCSAYRGQRRRPARRRHGHPEHQEREDRPADPAAAQHADGEAAPGPQPGQLQGEARRRRGRAHARRSRPTR